MAALIVVAVLGVFTLWLLFPNAEGFGEVIGSFFKTIFLVAIISSPFAILYIAWKVSQS